MNTKKPWYLSKTIWGIVIAAVGAVLTSQGVDVEVPANADYDQIAAFVEAFKAAEGGVQSIAGTVLTVAGFLLALYGRVVADTQIGSEEVEG